MEELIQCEEGGEHFGDSDGGGTALLRKIWQASIAIYSPPALRKALNRRIYSNRVARLLAGLTTACMSQSAAASVGVGWPLAGRMSSIHRVCSIRLANKWVQLHQTCVNLYLVAVSAGADFGVVVVQFQQNRHVDR
jgi:hypothetical protein